MKKVLILSALMILASIFLVTYSSRSKNQWLNKEELAQYESVYQEYPVQFLRKALKTQIWKSRIAEE